MSNGSSVRRHLSNMARPLVIAAVLAVGLLAPFAVAWIPGQTVVYRDSALLYAPQRWLAGEALRGFKLPLWNPYAGTGMPFLAETVHGVLHPISVAVAFLFPSDGLDPLLAAYVLSAGAGAAALARSMGASWPAALLAAFAYGLSGFTLSMTGNLVYLAGAASLPWMAAGLRLAGRDRSAAGFAAGSLGVAVCAFSGDIQALAVGGVLGLCLAAEAGSVSGLARASASTVIGAMLAAVQLLPSWWYLQESARAGGIAGMESREWALAFWRIIEFIAPGFFSPAPGLPMNPVFLTLGGPSIMGHPFSMSIFVGAPVFLLALSGVRSSRPGRVLGASSLVFFWIALGYQLGAQKILSFIPVVQGFRYAEKYAAVFTLCIALLAAAGLDRLALDGQAARRSMLRASIIAAGALLIWSLLAMPASVSWLAASGVPLAEYLHRNLLHGFPYIIIGLAAFAGCIFFMRQRKAALLAGIVFIVWTGLIAASPYALNAGSPEARLEARPANMGILPPGARVLSPIGMQGLWPRSGWNYNDQFNFEHGKTLSPSFNVRYRIDSFGMDSGIRPRRYQAVIDTFEDWGIVARRFAVTHVVVPRSEKTPLDGTLVSSERLPDVPASPAPDMPPGALDRYAAPVRDIGIWSVPHRPWALFPSAVEVVSDFEQAKKRLLELHGQKKETVVIEGGVSVTASPGEIYSLSRDRERVTIQAEAGGNAVLVVNDAFSPGWRAFIDGNEVPVWPADLLVRAVPWPAGRHTLEMRYDPFPVRAGIWISMTGGVLLLAAYFALPRRQPRLPGS